MEGCWVLVVKGFSASLAHSAHPLHLWKATVRSKQVSMRFTNSLALQPVRSSGLDHKSSTHIHPLIPSSFDPLVLLLSSRILLLKNNQLC
jgi:hypothetical protein